MTVGVVYDLVERRFGVFGELTATEDFEGLAMKKVVMKVMG